MRSLKVTTDMPIIMPISLLSPPAHLKGNFIHFIYICVIPGLKNVCTHTPISRFVLLYLCGQASKLA